MVVIDITLAYDSFTTKTTETIENHSANSAGKWGLGTD